MIKLNEYGKQLEDNFHAYNELHRKYGFMWAWRNSVTSIRGKELKELGISEFTAALLARRNS